MVDPFGLEAQRENKRKTRIENASNGIFNLGKGTTVTAMGMATADIGFKVCMIPLPGARLVGIALIIVGCLEIVDGYSDLCEGTGQLINAVRDTNEYAYNPVRDTYFNGNDDIYQATEYVLVYSSDVLAHLGVYILLGPLGISQFGRWRIMMLVQRVV